MEEKVITVTNISAFKRIAFFLCDLVINFFFCLMIVNFAVFPAARSILHFDTMVEQINKAENNKIEILEKNQILLYREESTKNNFDDSFQYSFECFVENFINDKENETIFYRYYVDIKNDKTTYISLFNILNEKHGYFNVTDKVTLKDEYKTMFSPYFDPSDSLSEVGKEQFETFREKAFVGLYTEIILDIKNNDLRYGDLSYVEENNLSTELTSKIENMYSFSTIIGYVLISLIYFIVIPISNENRYTLSQFFLRNNRIDCLSMKPVKKRYIALVAVIQVVANMGLIILIPSLTIGVETCFSLPYLFMLSLLSVVYTIVSLIFIIFNRFHRSLYDIFSNSVVIGREDFENILYAYGTKDGRK